MEMHYYARAVSSIDYELVRADRIPETGLGWHEITHERACEIASNKPGWVVMNINEIDRHALAGDGWSRFAWQPTSEQRQQAAVNHSGRTLEHLSENGGVRWEELFAILTCNPWRRLILMRAFTCCRDWPKSVVA